MITSPVSLILLLCYVSTILAAFKAPLKPTPPARIKPVTRPTPTKKPVKSINTDFLPTTDFAAATTTPTAAEGGGDTGCDATDTDCNYCNLALYEIDICTSIIAPIGGNLPDCLCYEATSNDASILWAPNYFDSAWAGCLGYASTSATDGYYDISTLQGYCSQLGNYDGAAYMDTSVYVLNLAAVATTTGDTVGGSGSVPTAHGATPSSSGAQKGVGIMGLLSAAAMVFMLAVCL